MAPKVHVTGPPRPPPIGIGRVKRPPPLAAAMLVAFAFQAKPGMEARFEALLNNAEAGRAVAKAMGATRNTLFLGGGRMVRVFEFPDGARPRSLLDIARADPKVADFLRNLGPLIQDGFDYDRPETLDDFNRRMGLSLAYDVRP